MQNNDGLHIIIYIIIYDYDMMSYSQVIRNARQALGLSQSKLAQKANLSLLSIQNIEAERGNPSISTLLSIFEALGIQIRFEPKKADWDVLIACGVPLSASRGSRPLNLSIEQLVEQLPLAVLNFQTEREQEALQAFLMALRDHYPSLFKKHFAKLVQNRGLLPKVPNGRVIKLRRLALERLAIYL